MNEVIQLLVTPSEFDGLLLEFGLARPQGSLRFGSVASHPAEP